MEKKLDEMADESMELAKNILAFLDSHKGLNSHIAFAALGTAFSRVGCVLNGVDRFKEILVEMSAKITSEFEEVKQ